MALLVSETSNEQRLETLHHLGPITILKRSGGRLSSCWQCNPRSLAPKNLHNVAYGVSASGSDSSQRALRVTSVLVAPAASAGGTWGRSGSRGMGAGSATSHPDANKHSRKLHANLYASGRSSWYRISARPFAPFSKGSNVFEIARGAAFFRNRSKRSSASACLRRASANSVSTLASAALIWRFSFANCSARAFALPAFSLATPASLNALAISTFCSWLMRQLRPTLITAVTKPTPNATALISPTTWNHFVASIEEIAPLILFIIAAVVAVTLFIFAVWAIRFIRKSG